jgi:UDP-2-acetamido-3-amino-2,3-dideoxy-glucuronate N-acetyltransferase
VRLGVIGAGQWGWNLVRNAADLGVLRAVCDSDAAVRARVSTAYSGVAVLELPADLIASRLDGVVIAAPARTHECLALQAINAGCHVFVEKPLALTVEGGERIAEAARRRGVVAFVGHLLLYHPAIVALLAHIRAGAVGEVMHMRSRRLSMGRLRSDENVWWSFAPHDVALMLAIFDDEPLQASSTQLTLTMRDICDFAYADFQFEGGRSAHIEASWLDPLKSSRLDVFGSTGALHFEDSRSGALLRQSGYHATLGDDGRRALETRQPVDVPYEAAEPLRRELEAFLHAVRSGDPATTSAESALGVLRALRLAETNAVRVEREGSEVIPA